MIRKHQTIENTLVQLFKDSENDFLKMATVVLKRIVRPLKPEDFRDVYLSISKEQGEDIKKLIIENNSRNIVEFGMSFGISTLYLAQGALHTGGHIVTTELIRSKAQKAIENFKDAGVDALITVKIGDAMETLKNHNSAIDLLLLDGWKDLYLKLFMMLEPCFHDQTIIYVDNANMKEVHSFLNIVKQNPRYQFKSMYNGKVVLITLQKL